MKRWFLNEEPTAGEQARGKLEVVDVFNRSAPLAREALDDVGDGAP